MAVVIAVLIVLFVSFVVMVLFAPLGTIILTALVVWAIFWFGSWAVATLGGKVMYGNDPDYQEYRRRGGSPFLDGMFGKFGEELGVAFFYLARPIFIFFKKIF